MTFRNSLPKLLVNAIRQSFMLKQFSFCIGISCALNFVSFG